MSQEAKEYYSRIYTAIQHIPQGRVTTYGMDFREGKICMPFFENEKLLLKKT